MNPDIADKLGDTQDFEGFARGVLALCKPFGPVHSFRLVHNRGAGRVACFIELEAPRHHPALARALGTRMVNGAVCFDVPVSREFGGPAPVVPLGTATATFAPAAR
jgi:hypothetical protein